MNLASFEDLAVGDRVWCLASIGTPFQVSTLDDDRDRVTIVPDPTLGSGGRPLELTAGASWLLTTEHWDQVWYWPDRAGERFDAVVQRFVAAHQPGEVIQGYFLDTGVGASNQGFVNPNPKLAMSLRSSARHQDFGQVRVKPVTETEAGIVPVGPNVPLRLGIISYRWSLSFGELIGELA